MNAAAIIIRATRKIIGELKYAFACVRIYGDRIVEELNGTTAHLVSPKPELRGTCFYKAYADAASERRAVNLPARASPISRVVLVQQGGAYD